MLYWYQNTDDGDGGLGNVVEVVAASVGEWLGRYFFHFSRK
jgi:hypothetical protein